MPETMSDNPAITASGLVKRFGGRRVVDGGRHHSADKPGATLDFVIGELLR